MKILVWIGLFLPFLSISQVDTTLLAPQEKVHSPRKAALFSAVVPGMGQVYNHLAMPKGQKKAFWKVPIIYAGLGVTTFLMLEENGMQRDLKREYTNRINGLTNQLDPRFQIYDDYSVANLYKQHSSTRDLLLIGMGVVYLLQVLDANVEANFVHFDISENIAFRIQPAFVGFGDPGLKLALKFK